MSEPRLIRLGDRRTRSFAVECVFEAPAGWVADIRPERRSESQNRLLWPCLSDVSRQVEWHGRKLSPEAWKDGFMMALKDADFVPGIAPGTIWPLGLSTKTLTKAQFSDLIELIYAFGAEHGVVFRGQHVSAEMLK